MFKGYEKAVNSILSLQRNRLSVNIYTIFTDTFTENCLSARIEDIHFIWLIHTHTIYIGKLANGVRIMEPSQSIAGKIKSPAEHLDFPLKYTGKANYKGKLPLETVLWLTVIVLFLAFTQVTGIVSASLKHYRKIDEFRRVINSKPAWLLATFLCFSTLELSLLPIPSSLNLKVPPLTSKQSLLLLKLYRSPLLSVQWLFSCREALLDLSRWFILLPLAFWLVAKGWQLGVTMLGNVQLHKLVWSGDDKQYRLRHRCGQPY